MLFILGTNFMMYEGRQIEIDKDPIDWKQDLDDSHDICIQLMLKVAMNRTISFSTCNQGNI